MKVLVTGAGGMLGQQLVRTAAARGHDVVGASHATLDVTDSFAVARFLQRSRPQAVLHCAAYTRVDDAESHPAPAFGINAEGAANVARACVDLDACFVYPSTDYVFNGRATSPYRPTDQPAPINVYGESKLAGEEAARAATRHLVVRTSWLYGAGGRNFVSTILERARARVPLRVVGDQRGSPTWTRDLATTLLVLLERDAPTGTYHACNQGEATWYELACTALDLTHLTTDVACVNSNALARPARRPAYSVLDCTSTEAIAGPMRTWQDALTEALVAGI
jgi:dTDP-4-dehydrorhamnose reductase